MLIQTDWCRHYPALRTAMLCNVYSAFVLPVWISKFLNACVSFVPISLMIPPRDSFPVHLVSHHHETAIVTRLLKEPHSLSRRVRQLRMTPSALFVGR